MTTNVDRMAAELASDPFAHLDLDPGFALDGLRDGAPRDDLDLLLAELIGWVRAERLRTDNEGANPSIELWELLQSNSRQRRQRTLELVQALRERLALAQDLYPGLAQLAPTQPDRELDALQDAYRDHEDETGGIL